MSETFDATPDPITPAPAPTKARKARKPAKARKVTVGTITDAGSLLTALQALTKAASKALGTVAYGAIFRTISGGHTNKRGLFVAAITGTAQGTGTFDTLKSLMAEYAVPAMRAEVEYAVNTGDTHYFRAKDGGWCAWALPLITDNALTPVPSDASLARAFEATCPPAPRNVNGMLCEITLASVRRNVTPLPVFADAEVTRTVEYFDADRHTAYSARGYGHATFTLTK